MSEVPKTSGPKSAPQPLTFTVNGTSMSSEALLMHCRSPEALAPAGNERVPIHTPSKLHAVTMLIICRAGILHQPPICLECTYCKRTTSSRVLQCALLVPFPTVNVHSLARGTEYMRT